MAGLAATQGRRFQWRVVFLCSLLAATSCAAYLLRSPSTRSTMFKPSGSFLYVVPIVVPFVAFLFDRGNRWFQLNYLHYVIDLIVAGTAMGRAAGVVPYISGHTLFLTHALLSSRSNVVRITAALVLIQAIYLKYFVWHDWITSTVGILLGILAALIVLKFGKTPDKLKAEDRGRHATLKIDQ